MERRRILLIAVLVLFLSFSFILLYKLNPTGKAVIASSCQQADASSLKNKWGLMENDNYLTTEDVLFLVKNHNLGVYYFRNRGSLDLKLLKESGLTLIAMSYGGVDSSWAKKILDNEYVDGIGYDVEYIQERWTDGPNTLNYIKSYSELAHQRGKLFLITMDIIRDYDRSDANTFNAYADILLPFYYGDDEKFLSSKLSILKERYPNKPVYLVGGIGDCYYKSSSCPGSTPSESSQFPTFIKSSPYSSSHYIIFGGNNFLSCSGIFSNKFCGPKGVGTAWPEYKKDYVSLLANLKNNFNRVLPCQIESKNIPLESKGDFSASFPEEVLTFVVYGDSHQEAALTPGTGNNLQVFDKIISQINSLNPSFVVAVGDLVHDGRIAKNWPVYLEKISKFSLSPPEGFPLFNLPVQGNHERCDLSNSEGKKACEYFRNSFDFLKNLKNREKDNQNYYSFSYGENYFIILSTENGIIKSTSQETWFNQVLKEAKNYENTFILGHSSPYFSSDKGCGKEERYRSLTSLINNAWVNKNLIYFAGHDGKS